MLGGQIHPTQAGGMTFFHFVLAKETKISGRDFNRCDSCEHDHFTFTFPNAPRSLFLPLLFSLFLFPIAFAFLFLSC